MCVCVYIHTLVLFLSQNIIDNEFGNQEPVSDKQDKSADSQSKDVVVSPSPVSENQGKNQDQGQGSLADTSVIDCLLSKKRNAMKTKVYVTLTPILCNCTLRQQLIFFQYLIRKAAKEAKVYGRKSFSDLKPVVRKYILDRVCMYVYKIEIFIKSEHTNNDVDLRSVVYVCVSDNGVQVEKQYPELGKHKDVFDRTVSRILSQHKYYRSEKGRGHVVCQRLISWLYSC